MFLSGTNKSLKGRDPVRSDRIVLVSKISQGSNYSEMTAFMNSGGTKALWFKSTLEVFLTDRDSARR